MQGERNYKFAVVKAMVVDKPHHVTLHRQKGEMGDGLLEFECWILCACLCVLDGELLQMKAVENKY